MNWRDRPLSVLWLVLALGASYLISEALWNRGWFPMPGDGYSLTTKVLVWRFVLPGLFGCAMALFLMRIYKREANRMPQVFVEPPRHSQPQQDNFGGW